MTFITSLVHNDQITLKKFMTNLIDTARLDVDNENAKSICFLDLETTGLNSESDKIVEVALKQVLIDTGSGELIKIVDSYESFNDPQFIMNDHNISIHGITNEMVSGKSIDWSRVEVVFENSDIIVAHNARFDRSFMDKYFPQSQEKVWACSVNDINWTELGFSSRSQELLCIWHGFYYESHRAMSDVDALIYLVTHPSYVKEKPIKELIDNAYQGGYKILALNSSIKYKDVLRNNGYYWNADSKYWWKTIKEEELEEEKDWLEGSVYQGPFLGQVELLTPADRYK